MSNPAITPEVLRIYSRMLNLFEQDSGSPETEYNVIYLYKDGNNGRRQTTLTRGFTDDGGNLKKVVLLYIQKQGLLSDLFKKRLPAFGKGTLPTDKEFLQALVKAGNEQAMKDAQDEVFQSAYVQPALDWAERYGIKTPLGVGVVVDSFLHSGTVPEWLCKRFQAARPASGGTESTWIAAYLNERLAWFTRSTGLLHTCTFRPLFFLDQVKNGNWDLNCPLVVRTKGKIC